jgi:sulfonate dioxygenase
MIAHARLTGSLVRKDPVESVHPLVRVHPVTGEKCLFINGEFITKIQGLKEPEFRVLQDFLMQHLITGHDFQARVRWQPRTMVMFDNRSTIRELPASLSFCQSKPLSNNKTDSAIVDYIDEENGAKPRHIFRLCALGEQPIPVNPQNITRPK